MNTSDLVDRVSAATGIDKSGVKKVIDATTAAIGDAARHGDDVSMAGFGQFKVKDMPARQGRNPATGATIEIAASRKLSFTPGRAIKDTLKI